MFKNKNEYNNELINQEENKLGDRIKNLMGKPKQRNDEDYYLDENNSELADEYNKEKIDVEMTIEDQIKNLSDRIYEIKRHELPLSDTIYRYSAILNDNYINPNETERQNAYSVEKNKYLEIYYNDFRVQREKLYSFLEKFVKKISYEKYGNDNNTDTKVALKNLDTIFEKAFDQNNDFADEESLRSTMIHINNFNELIEAALAGEKIDESFVLSFIPPFKEYLDETSMLFKNNKNLELGKRLKRRVYLVRLQNILSEANFNIVQILEQIDHIEDKYNKALDNAKNILFDYLSEKYPEISDYLSEYKEEFTFGIDIISLQETPIELNKFSITLYETVKLINKISNFNEAKKHELTLYRDSLEKILEVKNANNKLQEEQDSVNYQSDEQDSVNYQRKEQDTENYQIDEQDSVNYQKGEDI